MSIIKIEFSRFSAFYSPLIMTMAGGFLEREGFTPEYSVSKPGQSAVKSLLDGTVHVVQSAPSQAFSFLERGETPPVTHFAQINEMDGFFLNARNPDPNFSWGMLAGKKVLVDHGGQPLAMFKYACHREGLNFSDIEAIDAGATEEMEQAYREGEGDYIHLQGPGPQQLQKEGFGHVVASVGKAIGLCAFSSLAATETWLNSDASLSFMQAYRDARQFLIGSNPAEIARLERDFFPGIDADVLAKTISFYQNLGCWTPHLEITEEAFEGALDVFLHAGLITKRHEFRLVVSNPPMS